MAGAGAPHGRAEAGRGAAAAAAAAAAAIAFCAVLLPTLVVLRAPPPPRAVVRVAAPHGTPPARPPAVEPVRLAALTPDAARAYNAAVPFSTEPNPAARPFRFVGDAADRDRARDCLAAGVLYEAGDDAEGEAAVAQVVLNRLRHPAFPKSICAVVFQGSERRSGCQFTFSCDGALDRWHPGEAQWARARAIADAALNGRVFRAVGYATHYHTDWVVPYWQAALDKVARVSSHLFFRWSGWWGTPPAFRAAPREAEPVVAALAAVSPANRAAEEEPATEAVAVADARPVGSNAAGPVFLAALPAAAAPDLYAAIASAACVGHPYCKYLGWRDRAQVPAAPPGPDQPTTTLAFSYLRDPAIGYDKPLWNCRLTPRADRRQCMRGTYAAMAPDEPLGGVRRRSALPAPAPAAAPSPGG